MPTARPGASNGQVCRIAAVTDESGTETRFYDQQNTCRTCNRQKGPQTTEEFVNKRRPTQ